MIVNTQDKPTPIEKKSDQIPVIPIKDFHIRGKYLYYQYAPDVSMLTLSQRSGISRPSIMKITSPDNDKIRLRTLFSFLSGLGLTPAEIDQMRIGDIFTLYIEPTEDEDNGANGANQ